MGLEKIIDSVETDAVIEPVESTSTTMFSDAEDISKEVRKDNTPTLTILYATLKIVALEWENIGDEELIYH
ncbi:hypothetical protein Y032_0198g1605 [Ancylostoma ceylanicum]|nr:hypothetical protein Y032_0198g1605 [Ancylostoma ceylanicum]